MKRGFFIKEKRYPALLMALVFRKQRHKLF